MRVSPGLPRIGVVCRLGNSHSVVEHISRDGREKKGEKKKPCESGSYFNQCLSGIKCWLG